MSFKILESNPKGLLFFDGIKALSNGKNKYLKTTRLILFEFRLKITLRFPQLFKHIIHFNPVFF